MKIVDEDNEIKLQLLKIIDSHSRVDFWAPVKVGLLASSGKINNFNQTLNEFRIVLDEPDVFETNNVSLKTATRFYIPNLGIEFYSHFTNGGQRGPWWFGQPETFKIHERRELDRYYPLRDATVVIYKNNEKFLTRKLYDVSAGGFSILLSKDDVVSIKENESFDKVVLRLNSIDIPLEASVVKVRKTKPFNLESTPYAFKRVSFQFKNISESLQQNLNELLMSAF